MYPTVRPSATIVMKNEITSHPLTCCPLVAVELARLARNLPQVQRIVKRRREVPDVTAMLADPPACGIYAPKVRVLFHMATSSRI